MDRIDLPHMFRITAFVDILGWSSLTSGIDSLIIRKLKLDQPLTAEESRIIDDFEGTLARARQIDAAVQKILQELQGLTLPAGVGGRPAASHFWNNRHVTFVRFSDSVFIHSTSFKRVVLFVSELLKRGLENGVLFRAGISCGLVVHADSPPIETGDPRSTDVSLFADGITTAVLAERAGRGLGVRLLVHNRVRALLDDDDMCGLRLFAGEDANVQHEVTWWNRSPIVFNYDERALVTTPTREWLGSAIQRLETHASFDWNRRSEAGRSRICDTLALLNEAIDSTALGDTESA